MSFLAEYSNVVIAFSILLAVIYFGYFGIRLLNLLRLRKEYDESIREKKFYSNYDFERLGLEEKLYEINRKLVNSVDDFERINHLQMEGQKEGRSVNQRPLNPEVFLSSLSINDQKLEIDQKLVFVLTPFHPNEVLVYSAIVDALQDYGIRVIRGDEEQIRGDILSHIVQQMLRAKLVIANVTSRNPNVMYELGIAHALGKDVIMISSNKNSLPFDINSRRILFFESRTDLIEKLHKEIGKLLFA